MMPVLLAAVAILSLMRDIEPFRTIYQSLTDVDGFTKLTIIVLVLWTIAILLLILNNLLYRMLEGYIGPFKRGRWQATLRDAYIDERKQLKDDYAVLQSSTARVSDDIKRSYYSKLKDHCRNWPSHAYLVLPTRFGNVIRAFEMYADTIYGVDSISVWLRLQNVMSKNARKSVDDARAQVDFFVNGFFLTLAFIAVAAGRVGFIFYQDLSNVTLAISKSWGFGWAVAAGLVVARLAYEGAIERAATWGDLVKASFDLYLPELASKLGYKLPAKDAERRRLWDALNNSFLYNQPVADTVERQQQT
jgi:hypothetical protein